MLNVPKVLYWALFAGATLGAAVLAILRATTTPPAFAVPVNVLRYVILALAVGVLFAVQVVRGRIPAREPGLDAARWWRGAFGLAIATWGLAESLILIGALFYYFSGDALPVGAAALGLVLMVLAAPDRLAGE